MAIPADGVTSHSRLPSPQRARASARGRGCGPGPAPSGRALRVTLLGSRVRRRAAALPGNFRAGPAEVAEVAEVALVEATPRAVPTLQAQRV